MVDYGLGLIGALWYEGLAMESAGVGGEGCMLYGRVLAKNCFG